MDYEIGTYDSCPCGSGAKYKFCCLAKAKAGRPGKSLNGAISFFGPDDKTATKIIAAVLVSQYTDPVMERFTAENIKNDAQVTEKIKRFFASYGVKTVITSEGIVGCPHEEGVDYPTGEDCPQCPFWAGKQGTRRDAQTEDAAAPDDEDDLDDEFDDDEEDNEDPDDDDAEDAAWDAGSARVAALLGDTETGFDEKLDLLLAHLNANLTLPCEVTCSLEDFRWETPYFDGEWSEAKYEDLKKTRPASDDLFELLSLERGDFSKWMRFCQDIMANVRRISDGQLFVLGLAELEATDPLSPNFQLLDDYGSWFINTA